MRFPIRADTRFQRKRLLRDLHEFPDLFNRELETLGNFLRSGLTSKPLEQLTVCLHEPVDVLDHVDGYANRASLVSNGARNRLANPPCGIRREFESPPPFKFLHCSHQPDVALLN